MKNQKRVIFVVCLLLVFAIWTYINIRGNFLQILGIGEEYVQNFKNNFRQKTLVFVISFLITFIATYITTILIKKGLKKFFEEDKRDFPKLPNKSIAFAFGLIAGIFCTYTISNKAILLFNSAWFAKTDPIFNLDIGYFIFQKPFIETAIIYMIGLFAILSLYIAIYYILVFNIFLHEGINIETLKKNTFLKQLALNICIIIILISMLNIIRAQNTVFGKFLLIDGNTAINGAGLIDVTIKLWGYVIFSIVIVICLIFALVYLKQKKYKKLTITIAIIPAYLIMLFLVMTIGHAIFVKPDELDKEKKYLSYSIDYTKDAYGIRTEELELENSGTITKEDIELNSDVVNNINILNDEAVLSNLEEYQTNLGFYTFKNTKPEVYNIDDKNTLVYVSPREILSNDSRTYNSKTYEYTHGFGTIVTSASKTDETGHLDYVKNGFTQNDDGIIIKEPRIYFGMQTNTSIVINEEEQVEYDYPLTSTTNTFNTYNGKAGLNLGFLDRLILGIKEHNLKLAFSTETTDESSIITSRNIVKRAKMVMPYLVYDDNPYMVVSDNGELVWVLDAYTVSDQYPYSQKTSIKLEDGTVKEINYIRNSVKVLINAYDGTMKFYITDRTDPIVMAYWKTYRGLFEDLDTKLPEDVASHIVYPKFLYDVQSKILETYHNVKPEVLYRADDLWTIATENTSKLSSLSGTKIDSYYTMVKTVDSNKAMLGLVIPYTIKGKQNITAYLVGTFNPEDQKQMLTIYKFKTNSAILGTIQLDTLIEQDETISNEINTLNVTGAKITKNIIIVPVNNTLLYVEPIYQIMINEITGTQVPVLKKIIVASGNKIAIGDNVEQALQNLLSQEAVSIDVESSDLDALINQIIKANKNLEESNISNNWEMIGRDMANLQSLIKQLEETYEPQKNEEETKVEEVVANTVEQ